MDRPRIALCFFGITRSLRHTAPAIMAHAVDPARRHGAVRLYGHFFDQPVIANPRSGENIAGLVSEHELLPFDHVEIGTPDTAGIAADIAALAPLGDTWRDHGHSLRNFVHQLHSLDRVTRVALADSPSIILFLRPDLHYHDDLSPVIARALAAAREARSRAFLPAWQTHGGENDRFAITAGEAAHRAYGSRLAMARSSCVETGMALSSERLVAFALGKAGIPIRHFAERASRVRANDTQAWEEFRYPLARGLQRVIDRHAPRRRRLPLHAALTGLNFGLARLLWGSLPGPVAAPPGVTLLTRQQQRDLWRASMQPPPRG